MSFSTKRRTGRIFTHLLAVAGFAGLVAGTAHAAGTDAGTAVENTFTLDYSVGAVPQTQITNDPDLAPTGAIVDPNGPTVFTVDRIVNVTVTANGDTTVNPGVQNGELVFDVVNVGNDNQAYDLIFTAGVTPADDEFDVANLEFLVLIDTNGNGLLSDETASIYTPGTPTADISPDGTFQVIVRGDIPLSEIDGNTAQYTLVANSLNPVTSLDPNFAGTSGDETLPDDGTNDTLGAAENVLTDAGNPAVAADNAGDGAASDIASFIVESADLTGVKTVAVISDDPAFTCAGTAVPSPAPSEGPYAIPGACVEYTILVTNTGATVSATNIDIVDILPEELVFESVGLGGTWASDPVFASSNPAQGTECNGPLDDRADATNTDAPNCVITATGGVLDAGNAASILIRATVTTTP